MNVPQPWTGGVRFTRQSSKVTRNLLKPGVDPRGRHYYWLSGQQLTEGIEPDTDIAAIRDGAISITPLVLDHTHAPSLNHLSHWTKLLEETVERQPRFIAAQFPMIGLFLMIARVRQVI